MEKLETEKIRMEEQNQFLLSRLTQMEVENNRLSQQVAQLSAEVRGSRSTTPISNKATSPPPAITESPTLTPTLFKQEGEDIQMERIPFPTPATSTLEYSPTLQPSTLAEASDATQHPAAMLCDLQCPSVASKAVEPPSPSSTSLTRITMLQLLFLTMTSAAYSTVTAPLSLILHSLKTGLPLALSTESQISVLSPLIHWLILTPSLSDPLTASTSSTNRPVFRMNLLARLLACSPALARPLRDATGRALQLAVSEQFTFDQTRTRLADDVNAPEGRPRWESLLTMIWAIDRLGGQRQQRESAREGERSGRRRSNGHGKVRTRSFRRSPLESLSRVGKQLG